MAYVKPKKVAFSIDGKIQYLVDSYRNVIIVELDKEYEELSKRYPEIEYKREEYREEQDE